MRGRYFNGIIFPPFIFVSIGIMNTRHDHHEDNIWKMLERECGCEFMLYEALVPFCVGDEYDDVKHFVALNKQKQKLYKSFEITHVR